MNGPLDDFRAVLADLPVLDVKAAGQVRESFARSGETALGRLAEIPAWLASVSGRARPVTRPTVAVFAGTHGIARHGISIEPADATRKLVDRAASGAGAVNQVCTSNELGLKFYDLALDVPTRDFTSDAALDERAAAATIAFGMEAVGGGVDLAALGTAGVGGRTAAGAIAAALHGGAGADWIDSAAPAHIVRRQIEVIDAGLAFHAGQLDDPLEVLPRFGGREFLAVAGAIVAARMERIPVILDGFAACAAAAALHRANPAALDHCMLAQAGIEPGHRKLIEKLGLSPLLDLGIADGQGTVAALAAGLVKTAAQVHAGLAATLVR